MAVGPGALKVTQAVAEEYRLRGIAKSKRSEDPSWWEPGHVHFADPLVWKVLTAVRATTGSADSIPSRWNATIENVSPQAATVEFGARDPKRNSKSGHPPVAQHWMTDALAEMRAENG